ncbi:MAG: glycosyltransferase family 4 protein [Solirubrobacteraceae bacterium]
MTLKHLLVLNQYAPPDQASTGEIAFEVACAAVRHGAIVTLIAGEPSYQDEQLRAPRRSLARGVEIRRVKMHGQRGRTDLAQRILGYLMYLAGGMATGLRVAAERRTDAVLCFHNPPFLPLVGWLIARRRRCAFICAVLDVHPDVLVATRWLDLPRSVLFCWDWLNRLALQRADRVIVLSDGMRSVMIEKGLDPRKVSVIPLWAQPELTPQPPDTQARARHGVKNEELLVLFTGNMGVTQDLEPVFTAAARLLDRPVRFVFITGGVLAACWRERLQELPNVSVLPFQSDTAYRALVSAADAGLVTLVEGLERLVVPSRAFPFLSAAKPLLAVMSAESEIGRLIERHGCGARASTADDLIGAIEGWIGDRGTLQRAGERARDLYDLEYGRGRLCDRYVDLIWAATHCGPDRDPL